MAALLREHANIFVLDDAVDDESLWLAEREHRMAVALTEYLDLGEFSDEDQARLVTLLPRLPAELAPLAEMFMQTQSAD